MLSIIYQYRINIKEVTFLKCVRIPCFIETVNMSEEYIFRLAGRKPMSMSTRLLKM